MGVTWADKVKPNHVLPIYISQRKTVDLPFEIWSAIGKLVISNDLLALSIVSKLINSVINKELQNRYIEGYCFVCNGHGGNGYGSNDNCRKCRAPPEINWY
mgnify:CR=1 FL=1